MRKVEMKLKKNGSTPSENTQSTVKKGKEYACREYSLALAL